MYRKDRYTTHNLMQSQLRDAIAPPRSRRTLSAATPSHFCCRRARLLRHPAALLPRAVPLTAVTLARLLRCPAHRHVVAAALSPLRLSVAPPQSCRHTHRHCADACSLPPSHRHAGVAPVRCRTWLCQALAAANVVPPGSARDTQTRGTTEMAPKKVRYQFFLTKTPNICPNQS